MKVLFIALIVLLTSVEPAATKNEAFKPLVVLELFTSQGCSSCPPADALLENIKKSSGVTDVLALSYHVDYWNYIGWKDPFSSAEFSDLQRSYSRKFNSSSIYTPQMIINGMEHFVGSNAGTLKSKVNAYSTKNAENSISISDIHRKGKRISFHYDVKGIYTDKHLRIALVIDERTTSVSRGENKNRSLKNSNIVVQQTIIELGSNIGKGTIDIPNLVTSSDALSIISLVENSDLDIVGGIQVKL